MLLVLGSGKMKILEMSIRGLSHQHQMKDVGEGENHQLVENSQLHRRQCNQINSYHLGIWALKTEIITIALKISSHKPAYSAALFLALVKLEICY